MDTITVASIIQQVFDTIATHGQQMALRLHGAGMMLLTGTGTIAFSMAMIKRVIADEGVHSIVADILILSIQAGMISWIITDLPALSKTIIDGFDWIAATAIGASTSGNPAEPLKQTMSIITNMAYSTWQAMGRGGGPNAWEIIKNSLFGGAAFWFKLGNLVVMILSAALVGALYIQSQMQVGLAVIMMPVILPFMMIPYLAQDADGLIRFFLRAGMMRALGPLLLSYCVVLSGVANQIGAAAMAQSNGAHLDLALSALQLFISLTTLVVVWQIPSLASAMLSGSGLANLRWPKIPEIPGNRSSSASDNRPGSRPPSALSLPMQGSGSGAVSRGPSTLGSSRAASSVLRP